MKGMFSKSDFIICWIYYNIKQAIILLKCLISWISIKISKLVSKGKCISRYADEMTDKGIHAAFSMQNAINLRKFTLKTRHNENFAMKI